MIDAVSSVSDVRRAAGTFKAAGSRVGLVPTMGALHEGHVRLIEACRDLADRVIVSIFVNPTQFGPAEDLARYPRPLENDLQKCKDAGADLVFSPYVETIYPSGTVSTVVDVPGLSEVFEGASRPGHFRGVATVVLKLLEIVRPDVAAFGQKDYQQQLLIRRMVHDLHVPVEIVTMPTVREPDGLAMSSRNVYLKPDERHAAAVLFRALTRANEMVTAGERDAKRVRHTLRKTLESEQWVTVDYAEVADAASLDPLDELSAGRDAVAIVAVKLGTTRLIDNMLLVG